MLKVNFKEGFLQEVVQKYARKFDLEGFAQLASKDNIKIIVCGDKEEVDKFVDLIQSDASKIHIHDIEIEPHLKDKDYRGVFRVIE